LAGVAAVEHMGGPKIPWKAGRTDSPTPTTVPDGRLPDASQGTKHIHQVFVERMGFTDGETVALIGAHALGRCHADRSGYVGPWTRAETSFSNEYFRLLLEEKWTKKTMHEGKPWKGPLQYESTDKTLMMLPSDLALLQDPNFKKYVVMYAKDEALFFKDFASAFAKLLDLGVPRTA
jgi:cytochrome c peroxidase